METLTQNIKTQKLVSLLLLIAILSPAIISFSMPKKARADLFGADIPLLTLIVANTGATAIATGATATATGIIAGSTTVNTAISIKNVAKEVFRQFLMLTARRLLSKITQNTINWINTGFHGNPLYIENSKSFFGDIAKTEVRTLVDLFGYDSHRFPFGKDFALSVINSYQRQLADNAEYSLSRVINDPVLLRAYQSDFNVGGWNTFFLNTQYPQNNYIGFNMLATETLARRLEGTVQNNAQKVNTALDRSMGFLSPQTCPSNPQYNNLKNQFQRPSFQPTVAPPEPSPELIEVERRLQEAREDGSLSEDDILALESDYRRLRPEYDAQVRQYQGKLGAEKDTWTLLNTCPGGLVSTTPGSVVGSNIMKAINSKFSQTELGAALGNSFSAIFDALINKFLNKGLNSLTNTVALEGEEDICVFEYFGDKVPQCGGGSTEGGGGSCISEITIVTETLRGEVAGAIEKALAEDPVLAETNAGERSNITAFRDLVVKQLQSAGLEASATYNGNCNLSPNSLGVKSGSSEFGELYDVVRDDPALTIRSASSAVGRPLYNGNATWGFITNGTKSSTSGSLPEAPQIP